MKMGFNAVFWILVETALSNHKISLLHYPVMCAVDVPDLTSSPAPTPVT